MLETRGTRSDGCEVGHPGRAAKFASARTCSSDTTSFLASSDLFHLDTNAESFCVEFDKLSEIHASIGNIVEDSFGSVTLIFHVANFHFQAERFGKLTRFNHGFLLFGMCNSGFVVIGLFGKTKDITNLVTIEIDAVFLHLMFDELSGKNDFA